LSNPVINCDEALGIKDATNIAMMHNQNNTLATEVLTTLNKK